MTSMGTDMFWTLQTVELLLEHQSIPVIECVDRIARVLRKERIVSMRVPSLKDEFSPGDELTGRTLATRQQSSIVPSFLINLLGLTVL